MPSHNITTPSCLSRLFGASRHKALAPPASPAVSTSARLMAQISAAGLVLASAGFGAHYAWTTGAQHGAALAYLMVMMAVSLELAKPLSLAAALAAFRQWSVVRGAALGMLALVAVAYSLTAELTLMATTRGDAAAGRLAQADAATKAGERYSRAEAALAALPHARPAAALQAEIDSIDRLPGIMIDGAPCGGTLNGRVTREHCPRRAELMGELATANERQRLDSELRDAEAERAKTGAVAAADPGAAALSTYLAALGIAVPAALLSEWLVLVAVLALECGSALAVVLVQAFSPRPASHAVTARGSAPSRKQVAASTAVQREVVQVVQPHEHKALDLVPTAREEVKKRILAQLKASGGSKVASERGLAKLIGTSKPTARRALQSLVLAGVIVAEATRNGTMLRLVA